MCLLSSMIHQFGKHGPFSIQDVAPIGPQDS